MKPPSACDKLKAAVVAADKAVWKQKVFSPGRKAAEKKHREALKKFEACKKEYGTAGAVLYARALARAAGDAGVQFGLKSGFQKQAGLRSADMVKKHFKVDKVRDSIPKAKALAKKEGLEEATKYAMIVESMNDAKKGAKAGFITAQIGAAIVDVVGGVVTLGSYAAAAPFVHAAIGAGQKLTIGLIDKDIAHNEGLYAAAINKLAKKKKKTVEAAPEAETPAAAAAAGTAVTADAGAPWYKSTAVMAGAGLLVTLGVIAAVRASKAKSGG